MIWILSNLKKNIVDYIESQLTYGENIFFDESFDFKIEIDNSPVKQTKVITSENMMKKKKVEEIEKKDVSEVKTEVKKPKIQQNSVEKDWENSKSLEVLNDKIQDCLRCELGHTRTNFVFGTGDPNADLVIIGEAPGRDEDLKGEPFVGRSGKLLTKILESIGLSRDDVFIANIIKCRPPNNRKPSSSEVETCESYLHKQIELIDPKYILSLGLTATDTLLKTKNVMKDVRGEILEYRGRKLMITYHPAALLRNSNLKRAVWEDMKKLKTLLDE